MGVAEICKGISIRVTREKRQRIEEDGKRCDHGEEGEGKFGRGDAEVGDAWGEISD